MTKKGKSYGTKAYPVDAIETSNLLGRVEPMLTPELLISRHMKGIPELAKYTFDELKDQIELAMNDIELLTGLALTPVQVRERHPYDANLYRAGLFFKLNHRPVQSVESVDVVSANGQVIFKMPIEWIEMGLAHKGQIGIAPLLQTFGASNVNEAGQPSGGLIFIQALGTQAWLAAFWTVTYTYGLCHNGKLPMVVNQIVGMTAAINLLSSMQPLNRVNSQSLSADSISQSSSTNGPQIYVKRIEDLEQQRERLMQKIKAIFFNKYYLSNI